MTTIAVTSASIGTKLATLTDTKITGITVNQAMPSPADTTTQLVLIDAAAAPTGSGYPPRTLYAASLTALAFIFGWKPTLPGTPGLTAPAWPMSLGTMSIGFANGVFVQNCPAGITFNVTTG